MDYGSDLTIIGNGAFYWCNHLNSIEIPDTVTTLGAYAYYYNSSAAFVSIPASLKSIGSFSFTYCGAVTSFTVDEDNTAFCAQDGVLFNKAMAMLVYYPAGNARTSYTVPDTVTSIGSYAFGQAKKLTSLDLNQVTSIGIGALRSCIGLTAITIPDTVVTISQDAFGTCTGLQRVVFGSSVNYLGSKLFIGCTSLTELSFRGNAPATINDEAFKGVTATAYYPAGDASWTEEVRQDYGGTITWVSYQPQPSHVPGDINGDGSVNNKDVMRLQKYQKGQSVTVNEAALDVNGDGRVNNKDLTRLTRYVKYHDVEIH